MTTDFSIFYHILGIFAKTARMSSCAGYVY